MRPPTDLGEMIEGFRLYCLAESKRPTAIAWYMQKLRYFHRYLKGRGLPTHISEIRIDHLRAFLVHLQTEVKAGCNHPYKPATSKPLSSLTIAGYARAIKAFFSWLSREGYIEDNPARLLKVPKTAQVIVPTLSDDQIRRFFRVIDLSKRSGFRDYCIALIFLDTGIRLTELANLQIDDIDLEKGHLKVMGKGWKERLVPIGARVQKALWKYIHRYRPQPAHPAIRNLFLSQQGYPLSADRIYRLIRAYGQKAGLQGVRCSPHTFRHTFAKKFLLNGGDLFTLQKILGHSTLDVVRLYLNLSPEEVEIQHRKYSPVDLMKL